MTTGLMILGVLTACGISWWVGYTNGQDDGYHDGYERARSVFTGAIGRALEKHKRSDGD